MGQSPVASRRGCLQSGNSPHRKAVIKTETSTGAKREENSGPVRTRPWSGEPARTPPRTGRDREPVLAAFSGVNGPHTQSALARLTFLGGHAADLWPPHLERPGPTGQMEEYKRGCPHFWLVWSFLASVPGGKQAWRWLHRGLPGRESRTGWRPRSPKRPLQTPPPPAAALPHTSWSPWRPPGGCRSTVWSSRTQVARHICRIKELPSECPGPP